MDVPNIVVIVPEQWRGDLCGYAGHPAIRTPEIDALAEDGLAFTNAFSTNPICAPSRCSLVTGFYPHTRGHRTQRYLVGPGEPNLLASLKRAGYTTAMFGKNDVLHPSVFAESLDVAGRLPQNRGAARPTIPRRSNPFSPDDPRYYTFLWGAEEAPVEDHPDARTNRRAFELIDSVSDNGPFLAWINYGLAHPPYRANEPWWSMYDGIDVGPMAPPPACDDTHGKPAYLDLLYRAHKLDRLEDDVLSEIRRRYMAMISQADCMVGQVVEGLRSRGLWERTALFVVSDHGNYGGDYGAPAKWWTGMEDALIRVPLVAHVPDQNRTGVCDELVQHMDINETIRDLAGLSHENPTSSRSLMPILGGTETRSHRDIVLADGGHWLGQEQPLDLDRSVFVTLEDKDHLYYPWKQVIEDYPEESARAFMIRDKRWKYVWRQSGRHELYDTHRDPRESDNLLRQTDDSSGRNSAATGAESPHLDTEARQAHLGLKDRLLREVLSSADYVPNIYPDVPGSLTFPSVDTR